MSLVYHGEVHRNLSTAELRARLNEWLLAGSGTPAPLKPEAAA